MSRAYFSTGVSSLFEMATADARHILPAHLEPVEVRPQRSVLNVSAFLFRDTPVGPYAELVFSVVVPPVVAGWSRHPKAGFFPFMAATSSPESRRVLVDELRFPTHPDPIQAQFVERDDHTRVQISCAGDPVLDMTVTMHKWHDTTHYFHSFMMDGEQRLKADVRITGTYSMHEQERGELTLFPHALNRHLTLAEVSASPFREHWLKEGFEQFFAVERI
jgi:hypothetical protein